jgi:hypothetical protein
MLNVALQLSPLFRVIDAIARARFGPTGFACPCGCTAYTHVAGRIRVRRCKECGRQISVTSGTALMYSKIPLERWDVLLSVPDPGLYSITELQKRMGVARSTAHHVATRLLGAFRELVRSARPASYQHIQAFFFRAARKPMADGAPADIRALDAQRTAGDRTTRVVARFSADERGGLCVVALEAPRVPDLPLLEDRALRKYFSWNIEGRRRVSLRWMPLWIGGFVCRWNAFGAHVPFPDWLSLVVGTAHRTRAGLDPWLASA